MAVDTAIERHRRAAERAIDIEKRLKPRLALAERLPLRMWWWLNGL